MDLVGYSEEVYQKICLQFQEFAKKLNIRQSFFIPISALVGDNVVESSQNMDWYNGSTLLNLLESIEVSTDYDFDNGRFPVQYVIRPQSSQYPDYRGYAGRVAGGIFEVGDKVTVLPSGLETYIKSIDFAGDTIEKANPPQSVTLCLDDNIDISRGDMIVKSDCKPMVLQDLELMICWMNERPLQLNGKYAIKHTTADARCIIKEVMYKVNVNTLEEYNGDGLVGLNEIARIRIKTTKPLFVDPYSLNRKTGAIIIIDEATNNTVGVGMVLQ